MSTLRIRLAGLVLAPIRALNAGVRWLSSATHRLQYRAEGALLGGLVWFDHELDVHWQWPRRGRSEFLDRGVLASIPMGAGDRVLELCCGDGFYARRFYGPRTASVLALDADPDAIRYARRAHTAANVRYAVADITSDMPEGPFEWIVLNGALTNFTPAEIAHIASSSATALTDGGVLFGQVDVEAGAQYRFEKTQLHGVADLAGHLTPHFAHVAVLRSDDRVRTNLHFFASDDRAAILVSEHHPAVSWWSRESSGRFARAPGAAPDTRAAGPSVS